MSSSNYGAETLIRAARAAAEAFISVLDEAAGITPGESSDGTEEPTKYDPLHDDPPFTPNPQQSAPRAQQMLAAVTYLGAIGRLNAEEGRGANAAEVSEFAKKAGYSGGNAVNGWNSRPGSPRGIENRDGARFLNSDGLKWIKKDAATLGITVQGKVSTVPAPEK